jgi:cation:H+ antiporter
LVRSLETLGARFGAPQVLLGLAVALAADGPELTSAVTAQVGGQRAIGVGVLFGSNVFNIAVLLGFGSVITGGVLFHRRVVVLEGATAVGVAATSVALVAGALTPVIALGITLALFGPYLLFSALPVERLGLPGRWRRWLSAALREEEEEVAQAYYSPLRGNLAGAGLVAAGSLLVVVVASAVMEHAAARGGADLGWPPVIVGGVVLAAVTSLPNVVGAVYLARVGKGTAMLTEAMNSNTLNVVGGLVLPAAVAGTALDKVGGGATFTGWSYLAITALAVLLAYAGRGLGRRAGWLLLVVYAGFLAAVVSTA